MADLNAIQLQNAEAIANYGYQHGFKESQIEFAVKAAFIESTLGLKTQNANSSAAGLFGYLSGTWAENHANLGNRMSNDSQIHAFYDDIAKYTARFNDPSVNAPIKAAGLTLDQYIYIKHHDGQNYTDFKNAPGLGIFKSFNFHPDLSEYTQPEGYGAPVGGHVFTLYDPVYASSHAYWFTNSSYQPEGQVTIGELGFINGQDQD
ncbi:hypothetical protein [Pseudomonas entomophila]|uniref:hypothetical protein n=1 Tax=Pseudomonas entomophila TaxID=312306 RepID=UPI001F00AE02|nr:hypothetical protein [Pseudomonas entomophila]MCG8292074.1 hypothetical protein [Pseudomonas entomophila]